MLSLTDFWDGINEVLKELLVYFKDGNKSAGIVGGFVLLFAVWYSIVIVALPLRAYKALGEYIKSKKDGKYTEPKKGGKLL